MEKRMRQMPLILLIMTTVVLIACNGGDIDAVPEEAVQAVAQATQIPTVAPTVSIPTATPTMVDPTASPRPTIRPVTPRPSATAIRDIYVVQEFDTLLGIAVEFNTTTEALAAANGINEEDFLQIGQELIIPTSTERVGLEATDNESSSTAMVVDEAVSTESKSAATEVDTAVSFDRDEATDAVNTDLPANTVDNTASPSAEVTDAEVALPPAAPPPTSTISPPPPTISRPPNINPLTGLPVDDLAKLQRRPLMVRIGNDTGARQSQVGLNSADVVYEEITEWWVTRFTAIFLSETPDMVGPVRSARLINVQLVPQYQGALAHSGGSDPVRWEISQAPIANLDEYYNAQPYFYRPNEGWQTRLAIDAQAARNYMEAKELEAPVTLTGFLFADTIDGGQPGDNIYIPYPRATSFTEWHFDPGSAKYLRWINGSPLYDVNGGQVAAANVIVYFAQHQETDIVEDSNGATSIRIIVNGQGPAWFFRDGKLNKGFWETDGTRTPYFAFEDGSPYSLKPGNTWVEVVPTYYQIGLNSLDEASSRP